MAASLLLALLLGTATALTSLALIRIDQERKIALTAKADAEAARKAAEIAHDGEALGRVKIEGLKEELRLRLVQKVDLANGFQAIDRGDPSGSLAWFADALRLERGDQGREEANRGWRWRCRCDSS